MATTTLSFDIHVLELFTPIQAGSRLVIATDEEAQDPALSHRIAGKQRRHHLSGDAGPLPHAS